MRFFSTFLATALAVGLTTPAWALPTKAEAADRSKTDSHGKAGLVEWTAPERQADAPVQIAAAPAPAPKPVAKPAAKPAPKAKPAFVPHPTVAHLRSTEVLGVENVSNAVDFLPVLPGERVPLRALNVANGHPVAATWRSNGGTLAFGTNVAVWQAPLEPGVHHVTGYGLVNGRTVKRSLSMVVIIPGAKVQGGKLNGYPIGVYPKGYGSSTALVANRGSRDAYEVPPGFVELTSANVNVPLSEHYKLGDFAGKDNWVGGHKYLMVQPRVVEKLERIIMTLRSEGYPCGKLELMSAYRSPFLNEDIGNTTTLSRHTYGDAVDMLVPDLNKDGKADRADANIMMAAVTKLDKAGVLTGGGSIYSPNGAHGYFIHTDTRGALVRW